ncbi:prostaglandin D2 receptor-like [Tiliqua scincoides]|uniref:prostaglandin D2 receptor-like n=1 Tax=Tiliqua scincoides TaxID=71010 RepID=UPI003462D292
MGVARSPARPGPGICASCCRVFSLCRRDVQGGLWRRFPSPPGRVPEAGAALEVPPGGGDGLRGWAAARLRPDGPRGAERRAAGRRARGMEAEAGAYRCGGSRSLEGGGSALPGALLFAAGLAGNVLALGVLRRHRRREGRRGASAFYLLASALAATDLLGKCLLSPMVLAAYARNRSLSALWPAEGAPSGGGPRLEPGRLCQLFAFLMGFFGLAPTALLLAMALQSCLALGHPYCYQRHASRRRAALGAAAAAASCAALCALPLLGFGATAQYCPGSWCFMRMAGARARPYSLLYASLLGALVLAVCLCHLRAMRSLCALARRRPGPGAGPVEELGQLLLLGLMTVLFAVCSLPLIVRAYVGAFAPDFDENADLTALRFFSVNSIVDPWVFIIFRTSFFRTCLHRVARRLSLRRAPRAQFLETWERKESGPVK